jgi:Mn-dependent DtxR family transcriptional regulator
MEGRKLAEELDLSRGEVPGLAQDQTRDGAQLTRNGGAYVRTLNNLTLLRVNRSMALGFEWDRAKDATNRVRHKVSLHRLSVPGAIHTR